MRITKQKRRGYRERRKGSVECGVKTGKWRMTGTKTDSRRNPDISRMFFFGLLLLWNDDVFISPETRHLFFNRQYTSFIPILFHIIIHAICTDYIIAIVRARLQSTVVVQWFHSNRLKNSTNNNHAHRPIVNNLWNCSRRLVCKYFNELTPHDVPQWWICWRGFKLERRRAKTFWNHHTIMQHEWIRWPMRFIPMKTFSHGWRNGQLSSVSQR